MNLSLVAAQLQAHIEQRNAAGPPLQVQLQQLQREREIREEREQEQKNRERDRERGAQQPRGRDGERSRGRGTERDREGSTVTAASSSVSSGRRGASISPVRPNLYTAPPEPEARPHRPPPPEQQPPAQGGNPLFPLMSGMDPNPFVPVGKIGLAGQDVGRATLVQMSELSRRQQQQQQQQGWFQPQPGMDYTSQESASRRGSVANPVQQQQQQASSSPGPQATDANNFWANNMLPPNFGLDGLLGSGAGGSGEGGPRAFDFNDETTANAASAHEGLQVYTVGHLVPRGQLPDDPLGMGMGSSTASSTAGTEWSFSTMNAGGMTSGMGIGGMAEQQQQQQAQMVFGPEQPAEEQQGGQDSSSSDDDEVVRPSINTTDENGSPVAIQAPIPPKTSPSSSPKADGSSASTSSAGVGGEGKKLRVRRSTYVPGWAVPPRVLLVDDDAISRKLSTKFLQVFGCTTDVAVDGVSAVTKMNVEKYDLVLMVRFQCPGVLERLLIVWAWCRISSCRSWMVFPPRA